MAILSLFGKKATNTDKTAVFTEYINPPKNEVAAAITMALMSNNDMAAIAMALYLYNDKCHDIESGIITMKSVCCSEWNSKSVQLASSAYRR